MGHHRLRGEASTCLDQRIRRARASLAHEPSALDAFTELVAWVHAKSALLARRAPTEPDVVPALVAMARWAPAWRRAPATWEPARGGWRGLASLAAHLFARFEVPAFLARAWLTSTATPWQSLYVHLAGGGSVRSAPLPVRLTRTAAHRLLGSPHHLDPLPAARRAQILALGGSEALARAVVATRVGRDDPEPEAEEVCEEVLRFFVRFPEIALDEVGPIVDFVHARRLCPREGLDAEGRAVALGPVEPSLSLRGRTPNSVRRLVEAFHRDLARRSHVFYAWAPSDIRGASFVEEVVRGDPPRAERHLWTVRELCSTAELTAEGRALRHCVSTYAAACRAGGTSIWSLRVESAAGMRRAVTVEVDLRRRLVRQARGSCNAQPRKHEMDLLRRWAAAASLAFPLGFVG